MTKSVKVTLSITQEELTKLLGKDCKETTKSEDTIIGSFAFMEHLNEDGSVGYGSGEYVILKQTPHALYAIEPKGGYGSHELKAFNLKGDKPWKIISSKYDHRALQQLKRDIERFICDERNPTKRSSWISSVADGAERNTRIIEEILEENE